MNSKNYLNTSLLLATLLLVACGEEQAPPPPAATEQKATTQDEHQHAEEKHDAGHVHDDGHQHGEDGHKHDEDEHEHGDDEHKHDVSKKTDTGHAAVSEGNAIIFSREQQQKAGISSALAIHKLVRDSVWVTGSIKASANGEALFSAPAAGLIRANGAFPRVGQSVKKGQVLAYLSPRLGGETDYASLEADLAKTQLNLAQAKRERERLEGLFKEEAIAEKRLLDAMTHEKLAQAEQTVAQKRLGQLSDGGGIALRAPMDGVIAAVNVAQGAFVNEAMPLFHLVNNRLLWLEARVPESEFGRLDSPSGAWFSVDGGGAGIQIEVGKNGRLLAIGGVVDSTTRTVPVIFEFNPGSRPLPIGLSAKVQIYAGQGQEGVLIPASAVQDESGSNVVYVQQGEEAFERRLVQTGGRDAELIEIKAGLKAGERVVSQGSYLIRLSTSKSEPAGHAH